MPVLAISSHRLWSYLVYLLVFLGSRNVRFFGYQPAQSARKSQARPKLMRTLFLNPPSFEGFDGGASSRWPATREIESYWYPVWLCYPAGMLPASKVVDAPPHNISSA